MPAKVMIDAVRELYPDSELHCLQKDVRPYDEEASKNTIWHYITTVHDLADAASRMHMVISCDTLTLHVAAEMGIPTIGLIAFSPDFRWLLDREDCPWYPSLRLMRRRWHGEPWADVIKRIS
jgi:ADP-heptose:LPS heptosyltransferase